MKSIFWFRRDIRLKDNKGLAYALIESDEVYPIYILDKKLLYGTRSNNARNYFLKQCLNEIDDHISIFEGNPAKVLEEIVKEHKIERIYFNKDYSPFATKRDQEIIELGKKLNIEVKTYKDTVIFEKLEISTDENKPYNVFTPYKRKFLSSLDTEQIKDFTTGGVLYEKIKKFKSIHINSVISNEGKDVVDNSPFIPGERNAQKALKEFVKEKIDDYQKDRNFPSIEGTSRISAHLHFGTLSIRNCFREAMTIKTSKKDVWINELIWRDFYFMILVNYPAVTQKEFHQRYASLPWSSDKELFKGWCEGNTGFPIVDAAMRCMNATGWMHNRMRMITASFLVKDLHIDWRMGEKYFMQHLIDMEIASNNGGWQWSASTGTDSAPYFRIFSPELQAKTYDPENLFIKKWIPELNTDKYLKPIVDHKKERLKAIDDYKNLNPK